MSGTVADTLAAVEFFAEIEAETLGAPRSATVDALDRATVLLFPAAHVQDGLISCPAALPAVIRQLTGEI